MCQREVAPVPNHVQTPLAESAKKILLTVRSCRALGSYCGLWGLKLCGGILAGEKEAGVT